MARELQRRGFHVNHKRVLALMRRDNLLCVKRAFRPRTTDSQHPFRVYPNLANGLIVTGLNQLWVADITYVRLLTEFVYLAAVIDVFSRRCIGWELSRDIDTRLALTALHRAVDCRKGMDLSGLIHHSDQGVQYAAHEYTDLLRERGIRISMSRKGNPYDNAFAESFMKTLKYEEVDMSEYETYGEAYTNIGRFIEQVYNEKRLHSSIGYVPPNEFEKEAALRRTNA
jgi:transposase InsO family protein